MEAKEKKRIKEIIKLDAESFKNMKQMFESSDKENQTVAFELLKNLNVKTNMVYMLTLYKLYGETNQETWKGITERIEKELKLLSKVSLTKLTFDSLFDAIENSYPVEDIQVFVDEYRDIMKMQLNQWGFKLINKLNWQLTPK